MKLIIKNANQISSKYQQKKNKKGKSNKIVLKKLNFSKNF